MVAVTWSLSHGCCDNAWAALCRAVSRVIYRGNRPAGVQYQLAVKTGDVRGAGTSANVYLIMHGVEASGRKHQLTAGPHDFDR